MELSIRRFISETLNNIDTVLGSKEIHDEITKANGLLSILGLGIKMYKTVQESSQSQGQKAMASLLTCIFEVSKGALKELLKNIGENEVELNEGKSREFLKLTDLVKEYKDASNRSLHWTADWDSDLPNHPVVRHIRSKIITYLKERKIPDRLIVEFVENFNTFLLQDSSGNCLQFRRWHDVRQQQKNFDEYLSSIESLVQVSIHSKKTLNDHYLRPEAFFGDTNTWTMEDEEVRNKNLYKLEDIYEITRKFLCRNNQWYIFLGGTSGVGKTSTAKMLAAKYATNCLYSRLEVQQTEDYIPIFISLKSPLSNVHNQIGLDYLLDKIIAPTKEDHRKNVLVIADGLEEYKGKIEDLLNYFTILKENHYPKLKVIIGARLTEKLPSFLDPRYEYIRILPFTKRKLCTFLIRYGVEPEFVYRPPLLELEYSELVSPTIAWMFAQIYVTFGPILQRLLGMGKLTMSMMTSLFFVLFLNYVMKEFLRKVLRDDNWEKNYVTERKLLREAAARKQIQGGKLTEDIAKVFKRIGMPEKLPSYFETSSLFPDYLLAEYYLQSILNDDETNLVIGMPSKETIFFLSGLIDLLKINNANTIQIGEEDDTEIFKIFEQYDQGKLPHTNDNLVKRLNDVATKMFNNEDIIVPKYNAINGRSKLIHIPGNEYRNIWINRWISLYVMNRINLENPDHESNIISEKLVKLIRYTGELLPSYLKNLHRVDLTDADLSGVHLNGADLSDATLHGADLTGADLSGANLSGSNLQDSILLNTNLSKSDLSNANLSDAITVNTDLTGAKSSDRTNTNGTTISFKSQDEKSVSCLCRRILSLSPNIRFAGKFDSKTYEFKYSCRRKNMVPLLNKNDKIIMLHISSSGYRFRKRIQNLVGKGLYVIEEYEDLKRITIPLRNGDLLFVTLDKATTNVEQIIKRIRGIYFKHNPPAAFIEYNKIKDAQIQIPEITSHADLYDRIVQSGLAKLRYVGISDEDGKIKFGGVLRGVKPKLDKKQRRDSVRQALKRWKLRQKFVSKIGRGLYTVAVYQKMKRITFPLNGGYLLLVTTELDANHGQIVDKILKLISLSRFTN
jgi:hypothetical protein